MDNVVYIIGNKRTGKFWNAKNGNYYDKITFSTMFPSKLDCETILSNFDDSSHVMIEGEVIEFKDGELTVAFENFIETVPY